MRNLKLEIEYDGTDYCGWQIQRHRGHKRSIQETLQKTLSKILQEKIRLIASGRTDAGVHASAQVANFKTNSKITPQKLLVALNSLLPGDITITKVEEKRFDFHSRFDAKSKIYRYTILNRSYPSTFLRNTAYFYPHPLNIRLMRKETKVILGRHNFKSFQGSNTKQLDTVRTIKKIKINKNRDLIYIDIEGEGFLYNMVRNIVGTLIEIGRGKFPQGSLKRILHFKNRKFAGPTVPAKGLCLIKVKY
jgi:tRNA pseudouridine38-40 synthase